jgi:hypothetical protein
MNENRNEEHGIIIRDDGCPANDHTPTEGHDPVSDVVLVGCQDTFMRGMRNGRHTGLREYLHQPLINRRLLRTILDGISSENN